MNVRVCDEQLLAYKLPRLIVATCGNWSDELPACVRKEMADQMSFRRYSPGETVTRAGDPPDNMLHVISGVLKLTSDHPNGTTSLLAIRMEGSAYGETAIVADRPLNHTTIAKTEAIVGAVPKEVFWKLYRSHSEFVETLCRSFAISLSRRVTNQELRESKSLKTLVAMVFVNLAECCGRSASSESAVIDVPITQSELAAMFGVTRQSVQTVVSQMKARGVLEKRDGCWNIMSWNKILGLCSLP